jgi:hypothetical protein
MKKVKHRVNVVKIAMILIFISISFKSFSQTELSLRKQIEYLAHETELDTSKIQGFVVSVLDGDSIWNIGFGTTKKGQKIPPDGESVFELGGLSPIFIVKELVEKFDSSFNIQIQKPINSFLVPSDKFRAGDSINLYNLLTHTSGLPKLPVGIGSSEIDIEQPYMDYSDGDMNTYLQSIDEKLITRDKYQYSFINFALLGKLTNLVNDTLATVSGYNHIGNKTPIWQFNSCLKYSLGKKSSSLEISKLIKNWALKSVNDQFFKIQYPTLIDKNTSVCLGWHLTNVVPEKRGKPAVQVHLLSGSTNGNSAFVGMVRNTKTAVIILSNSPKKMTNLGMQILRLLNDNWKRTKK